MDSAVHAIQSIRQTEANPPQGTSSSILSSPISILPNEILQYIFHYYTHINTSLVNIRLVCQLWRDLVSADPTLPRRIRLGNSCPCESRLKAGQRRHNWDYCCRSIHHLSRVLTRYLQKSNFELIVAQFAQVVNQSWDAVSLDHFRQQCMSIRISQSLATELTMEVISKRLPPLLGLKSLALVCQPEAVSTLLKKVDIEGGHLETLTVGWVPGSVMPFDANQWRDVLSKLKSFTVPTGSSWLSREFCITALSSFRNLESLEWGGALLDIATAKRIQESVKWQFTLRHLRTQDVLLYTFPPSVLQTLITMKLLGTRRDRDTTTTITLPNLTELCLLGTWRHLLRVQAPKLEYLQLRACGISPLTASIPKLIHTQLRPSRLETEEIINGSLVEALITGPFRDITELNVQVEVTQKARSSSLVKLICHGSDVDGSTFCPKLRHLVVTLSGLGTAEYHSELNDAVTEALNRRGPKTAEVISVRFSVSS